MGRISQDVKKLKNYITLCLQDFPQTLPSGTPSGNGLYLTVCPSSCPNIDTVCVLHSAVQCSKVHCSGSGRKEGEGSANYDLQPCLSIVF